MAEPGPPQQRQITLSDHDVGRARRLLMLEFGSRAEFEDPGLEYRRLFAEILGTFMLVLAAAGGGLLHAQGQISLAAAVVAPGLMVLADAGALIAVGCAIILRGPGGDPISQAAGAGRLK